MVDQVLKALAVGVIAIAFLYLAWGILAGIRQVRRGGRGLGSQALVSYGHPHQPEPDGDWFVYFLIPALNEAAVIANTVAGLTGGSASHVIVIDDGSDDDTGPIASAAGGDRISVVRRELPDARKGKGAALNAGYEALLSDMWDRGLDRSKVIVCVMDADGRLSDGAISEVLPAFEDPAVGAVQLAVRIRNRETFLTAYQDYLFWSMAALTQFGRMTTGTVSLGGNGQFTRLTALQGLGRHPWSDSLTEDLDLGIRLALDGWVATSAPGASVDQQAVGSLKRLVRQRQRWYQGHMAAGGHIPAIWNSTSMPHRRALELIAYLAVPWVLDLPWTVLYHVCLIGMLVHLTLTFGLGNTWTVPLAILGWYLVLFAPCIACGLLYHRRDPRVGLDRALLFGHAFMAMNYVSFYCVWTALFRILRGDKSWAKTVREVDTRTASPVPALLVPGSFPLATGVSGPSGASVRAFAQLGASGVGASDSAVSRALLLRQARLQRDPGSQSAPKTASSGPEKVRPESGLAAATLLHRGSPRLRPLQ